MVRSTHHQVSR